MFYLPTNPNISEYVSGNTGIFWLYHNFCSFTSLLYVMYVM